MAIFSKKADVDVLLEPYKAQIEMLKDRVSSLETQNNRLTEALMSVRAPVAYRELRADEAAASNQRNMDPELIKRKELEYEIRQEWLNGLEGPGLTDFDEFENFLRSKNPPTGEDVESKSLHRNSES